MNSRDKGIEEAPQFIDSDDKCRKCLLIDSDEEGTADFIKIDYLAEKYRTHHANESYRMISRRSKTGSVALIRLHPANLRLPQLLRTQMMRHDHPFPQMPSPQLHQASLRLS
jgi:hypothetical protein